MMAKSRLPMMCFCCVFNLWVESNYGRMKYGERDGCVIGGEAGERRRRRSHWSWGVQSVGKSWVGGFKIQKEGGGTEKEEREKGSKKQGQYTQRNVVLQTVELAKLKCTVTMGTLGETEEKKD